jgi:hypothetical protein
MYNVNLTSDLIAKCNKYLEIIYNPKSTIFLLNRDNAKKGQKCYVKFLLRALGMHLVNLCSLSKRNASHDA